MAAFLAIVSVKTINTLLSTFENSMLRYLPVYIRCSTIISKPINEANINIRNFSSKNGGVKTEITTQLWDVNAMKKIGSWQTGVCIPAFLIFPIMVCGSTIIVSGSEEGVVTFVHTQSNEVLHTFKAHEDLGTKYLLAAL